MADATGIYVGSEAGRSGERRAAAVAWASLRATLAPTAVLVGILVIWAHFFAALYSRTEPGRSMTAVIPVVGVIILIDCAGFVMSASLRALREVAWPTGIEIGSMLLLVPLALTLGISGWLWRTRSVPGHAYGGNRASRLLDVAILVAHSKYSCRAEHPNGRVEFECRVT